MIGLIFSIVMIGFSNTSSATSQKDWADCYGQAPRTISGDKKLTARKAIKRASASLVARFKGKQGYAPPSGGTCQARKISKKGQAPIFKVACVLRTGTKCYRLRRMAFKSLPRIKSRNPLFPVSSMQYRNGRTVYRDTGTGGWW